ncbi:Protein of uncharacterised function (DUF2514) [Klebsiella pneumoniae]|uniref:Protein of uncharacterized function (DUF2514) n=1 Tax=Klebsiella pneumoniae TaxID=573 RepID=A0A377WMP0_KLEPN|nr:Protein of uncharacterised function (DUF2514) [Klebsiella pneumoniae]
MNVKRSRGSTRRAMMLLMLPLVLAGCSSSSLPSVSSSGSITPLSALGRQPQTPEFLLTNVFEKSLERNRQLAEYADRAAEAGRVCERQYDELTEAGHNFPGDGI